MSLSPTDLRRILTTARLELDRMFTVLAYLGDKDPDKANFLAKMEAALMSTLKRLKYSYVR